MPPPVGKPPSEDMSIADLGDGVDATTFGQILEMDDSEDDREFSRTLVLDYLEQARDTFDKMNETLQIRDLKTLSDLGHYLKGSSATLGLVKVKEHCEKIQRYGRLENVDGSPEPNAELCLTRIASTLQLLVTDFEEVEKVLKRFYKVDVNSPT